MIDIKRVLRQLPKDLTPEAKEALSALHSANKPMKDMVEWTALDVFRMRKVEDTPDGLIITVREFQIKELP